MKVSNRSYDFDHGSILNELECTVCEGPLAWDIDDYNDVPRWTAECCGHEYELHIKSIRGTVIG